MAQDHEAGSDRGDRDAALRILLAELEARERGMSARRRRLHDRIDFARSGALGWAAEDQVRALIAQEREISRERAELHGRIEELRANLGLPPFSRRSGAERRADRVERGE